MSKRIPQGSVWGTFLFTIILLTKIKLKAVSLIVIIFFFFLCLEPAPESDTEDEWPPFRKTGVFDPYSDDPRLAVKRVALCSLSGSLVVAGTAGHVVIAIFDTEVLDGELKVTTMNIVNDRDGFVWKGHNELTPKQGKRRVTKLLVFLIENV